MTSLEAVLRTIEARSGEDLSALASPVLDGAPHGALTVVNGRLLEPRGGWLAFGRALDEAATDLEQDVLVCQLGGGAPHVLFDGVDGEFVVSLLDWDTDLQVPAPDWESDAYDDFDPDPLAARLSPFGSNSLPRLARELAADNLMSGAAQLLLVEPGSARPYAGVVERLRSDGDERVRAGAVAAVHEWLAEDLATFAAERPSAATIVCSDDRDPEWAALARHAGLVLPGLSAIDE